jgi:hypothetical protein
MRRHVDPAAQPAQRDKEFQADQHLLARTYTPIAVLMEILVTPTD